MKKNSFLISSFILCSFFAFSCGKGNEDQKTTDQTISAIIAKTDSLLPNYRYVDLDTILVKYNLAKDYSEEMLRMQSSMESEVKRHENTIQSFAASMQNKMQKNEYLTEASYKADQQHITDLQNKAQKAVAALQANFENAAMQGQKAVNDSIEAFIRQYNKDKGYDAIFLKAATLYINPALDITDEVVEGLNARYNKVK